LRHGLSFARRSATRRSPDPFTTWPELLAFTRGCWPVSGNAHGIRPRPSQCSLAAGPRISAVHPHMSFRASRAAGAHTREHPLIFTGGRSRIFRLLPDWGRVFQNATGPCASCMCARDTDRLLGPAAAAKPSGRDHPQRLRIAFTTRGVASARSPILPWAFRVFSRACRMPLQRHVWYPARCRARDRPPFAAAVPFLGCHPLVGFADD
jgi:hypothetical protein